MMGSLRGSFDERRTVPLCLGPQRRVINVNTPSPLTGFCGSSKKIEEKTVELRELRIAYHHNHKIEVDPCKIRL